MTTPLAGIRVLDLSRILAGPWCTQTLADLGAEVIKIERPGVGDDTRHWGPPYARDAHGQPTSEAAYFLAANRGKASVTVDFTTPEGRAIVSALAAQSDVVIENFRVGQLAKYGLDAATLRATNQRLIYCSITGFGQTGPNRDVAGYDFLIQGMGGVMSVTGQPDGAPGAGPVKAGMPVADLVTGLYATIAILASLNRRNRTGEGDVIDMALFDCQVAVLANQAMNYLTTGTAPTRLGNGHPNIVPYQDFPTRDGEMLVAVGNDKQFRAFAEIVGHPEWADDPLFATNPARVANRIDLTARISVIMQAKTRAEWTTEFTAAGIPAGPINSIADTFAEQQVAARGLLLDLPHAIAGHVPSVAGPIRYGNAERGRATAPPTLGQHTAQILAEKLGLGETELAGLRAKGII